MNFKPIPRWPNKLMHIRNIGIALHIAKGGTCREIGEKYNLSRTHVNQIHRIAIAYLCERKLGVKFIEAFYDKRYYKHFQSVQFIMKYHKEYIHWADNPHNLYPRK